MYFSTFFCKNIRHMACFTMNPFGDWSGAGALGLSFFGAVYKTDPT